MNYIWELEILAKQIGVDPQNIFYRYGNPFSAYMELSFEDMNETNVLYDVEINPYYRYYKIFKKLFEPNLAERSESIDILHDLVIHHLAGIDVLMGMNKRDYHISFVIQDMHNGFFGEYIKEKINIFTNQEQHILANNVLHLYSTAEAIHLLKDTVSRVFARSYIFFNVAEKDQIVLYLRTKHTKQKDEKIEVIKYLFLPFRYSVEVYWEYIFGVIGVDELMKLDKIMSY